MKLPATITHRFVRNGKTDSASFNLNTGRTVRFGISAARWWDQLSFLCIRGPTENRVAGPTCISRVFRKRSLLIATSFSPDPSLCAWSAQPPGSHSDDQQGSDRDNEGARGGSHRREGKCPLPLQGSCCSWAAFSRHTAYDRHVHQRVAASRLS